VLVHDHRNFGASDGAERGEVDPWQQIADWRRAISFLNVTAVFLTVQAALALMGAGAPIILNGSMAATIGTGASWRHVVDLRAIARGRDCLD
jgi:NAD(P)-dependent dehydrogenase (short-subunit alcohol dehydrogenase family)